MVNVSQGVQVLVGSYTPKRQLAVDLSRRGAVIGSNSVWWPAASLEVVLTQPRKYREDLVAYIAREEMPGQM
jgi:hypothetical protein